MRAIGTAERALEMMCRRANERQAFGGPLGEKQFVQEAIAASRMEIDQARLLTLYAAWKMDTEGKRAARQSISAIKIVAANMVMDVLDRAIQIHGSLGMTDDTPLAALWRFSRMLRLADGPDEVHKMVLARRELNRWAKRAEAEAAGELEPEARPARDLRFPSCRGRRPPTWTHEQYNLDTWDADWPKPPRDSSATSARSAVTPARACSGVSVGAGRNYGSHTARSAT